MTGRAFDGRVIDAVIDPDQQAIIPDVSGNDVNGRGEPEVRSPTPIYWQDPRTLAHGAMQMWMLEKTRQDVPEIAEMQHGLGGRGSNRRTDISDTKADSTAEAFAEAAKAFALANESDQVGIARMRPEWVYEGMDLDLPWVIVIAVAMDHAQLATAPDPPSVVEVMRQYNRGTRAARALADWIRGQGYDAHPHGGPTGGPMTLVPAALQAGLGELGKHGSIINRTLGASFRLAGVVTDMPLVADVPDSFGVDDFCMNCRVCEQACPPDAISADKQLVRGVTKWYVDFDKCAPYFNQTYGCGICIAVCPWSRPEVGPKLLQKMLRRLGNRRVGDGPADQHGVSDPQD
jgi:epoxyqueuosine reductase